MFNFTEEFDVDLAQEGEGGGLRYPAIMADTYKPANTKIKVTLGLTEPHLDLLDDRADGLVGAAVSIEYGEDVEQFSPISDGVRWVVLAQPRLFAENQETKEISTLTKGMSDRGEKTVSKVLLGCLVNDKLVLDSEGLVQIFTLKLKSTKTNLIGNRTDKDGGVAKNADYSTIASLNNAVRANCKGAAKNAWVAHLASIELLAVSELFTKSGGDGKKKADSSMGIRFIFGEGAKQVPREEAKKIVELIGTEEFKEFAKNPFVKFAALPATTEHEYEIETEDGDLGF
jgi:hypothetical protein